MQTKGIYFGGRKRRIMLQEKNGPCALIAIYNHLVLKGEVYSLDTKSISITYATELIAKKVESGYEKGKYSLEEIVAKLVGIGEGMCLDIGFDSVFSFEQSIEREIFRLLNIQLCHCWLPDPNDSALTQQALQGSSSTEALNELFEEEKEFEKELEEKELEKESEKELEKESEKELEKGSKKESKIELKKESGKELKESKDESEKEPKNESEKELKESKNGSRKELNESNEKASLIKSFMFEDFPTQATPFGITQLTESIDNNELIILYRNNHFMNLFKHNNTLFLLCTDVGFKEEKKIVWQSFTSIDGNDFYFDSRFRPFSNPTKEFPISCFNRLTFPCSLS